MRLAALLVVVWIGLFVAACAWWTPHPRWVPVVAVVALLAWVAMVAIAGRA